MFSAESFLWNCLWQSTISLAAGLLISYLLHRHSARAHQVLLLSMLAAVIDRTKVAQEMRIEYRAHLSNPSIRRTRNISEKKDKLRFFLDTLSAPTNLQFEITREPIEVWFITEETKN